jgi:hypothetical protein
MMKSKSLIAVLMFAVFACLNASGQSSDKLLAPGYVSGDTVVIHMAALDQPWMYNRMGAAQPTGMIYALETDIISKNLAKNITTTISTDQRGNIKLDTIVFDSSASRNTKLAGNVRLRDGKRPRPIALRANQGDIVIIHFTNYLREYDSPRIINIDTFIRVDTIKKIGPRKISDAIKLDTITEIRTTYNNGYISIYPTDIVTQETINPIYPATREAGVHITGMQLVTSILDDGSFSGTNGSSLVAPGETITYTLFAAAPGNYLISSGGGIVGNGSTRGGTRTSGLFGMMNVQPPKAEWYRSQVSEKDLFMATKAWVKPDGSQISNSPSAARALIPPKKRQELYDLGYYPVVDYDAISPIRKGIPLLKLYKEISDRPHYRELVHSDLTAIITGPKIPLETGDIPYNFPASYAKTVPDMFPVYATPNQLQPYREFDIIYHEAIWAVQAFPKFYDNGGDTLHNITETAVGGLDQFAINYGTGGISAEIYANRVGVGPMAECTDCAYEEFFLSAWAVGDPAMVVNVPANVAAEIEKQNLKTKIQGNKLLNDQMLRQATLIKGGQNHLKPIKRNSVKQEIAADYAYYPEDPSNVYHSYMNDHVKFRIGHAGTGIVHIHHQHAAQWLHSPNSQNGHYLDSQTINPGATYTLNMSYNGSGNLNKTVGDKIFHCHFYPHFAQGMWSMWRVHDVLELGSVIDPIVPPAIRGMPPLPASPPNGPLLEGTRGLPDGEIWGGTPIPGLVPIPNMAMAPVPAKVVIDSGQVKVTEKDKNPGYPFFIPGVAGKRAPQPPMDFAKGDWEDTKNNKGTGSLNGGLPRKVVIGGEVPFHNETIYDWTKITDKIKAIELPEEGTYFEQVAMKAHAQRNHSTFMPLTGKPGTFTLNGLPPRQGAPYADPGITLDGKPVYDSVAKNLRIYKAANIQIDAVINKDGWHYPQTRPIVLWGDVASTVAGERPPQPFFFRSNSKEIIEFWQTNLVPEYYELDDYQVRTPTDVIGQHIHLVKFDVTSSDGAANGFNYEDGTLAPNMVVETIEHINNGGALYQPDLTTYYGGALISQDTNELSGKLYAHKPMKIWGDAPSGQDWTGAQTTIQRWYADPLFNNDKSVDRTLRTVFTHDHFGPSTHQQVGLYAGLLIEPENSSWFNSSTGDPLGTARPGYEYTVYDANGKNPKVVKVPETTRTVATKFTTGANGVPSVAPGSDAKVADGGPTDWQAIISTPDSDKSYREFMYEFQDNHQAYLDSSRGTADKYPEYHAPNNPDSLKIYIDSVFTVEANAYRGWIDAKYAINAPGSPEIVSTGGRGVFSVNYRNEPLPIRVHYAKGDSISAHATDLAYSFSSLETRGNTALNSQPAPGYINDTTKNKFIFPKDPISPDMQPGDPYTPLARAYTGDRVQVRTLVGAHVNPHYFTIHGLRWLFEPSNENSGFRSVQAMGLSEHFELNFTLPNVVANTETSTSDYLIKTSADEAGMQGGSWGILRSYQEDQANLAKLPNNPNPKSTAVACGCPTDPSQLVDPSKPLKVRKYDVTAISIDKYQMLLGIDEGSNWGKLAYNERYRNFDSRAIVMVRTEELDDFKSGQGYRPDPLVLRANAGECIKVTLRNDITPDFNALNGSAPFNNAATYNYNTSFTAGIHPELLSYDVGKNDGTNVGLNKVDQLVQQGPAARTYEWYAGQWKKVGNQMKAEPVEFGSVLLSSPDPLQQYLAGLFGAMIIEPEGSYWVENRNRFSDYTSANVYKDSLSSITGKPLFREFVMIFQDNIALDAEPNGPEYGVEVNGAINYRSEPLGSRVFEDAVNLNQNALSRNKTLNFNPVDISDVTTDRVVLDEPETPIFVAAKGSSVRFRVLHTGGNGDGNVFDLHGHVWQEEPYTNSSTKIGYNETSQWMGTRAQLGAHNSFDLVIDKAGGNNSIPGDYPYIDWRAQPAVDGVWGLFRVTNGKNEPVISRVVPEEGNVERFTTVYGSSSVDPTTGKYPVTVGLQSGKASIQTFDVSQVDGSWTATKLDMSFVNDLAISSTLAGAGKPSGNSRVYPPDELRAYTKEKPKVQMQNLDFGRESGVSEPLSLPSKGSGPNR